MKNILKSLMMVSVGGILILSAFLVDLVPTSDSLMRGIEKKTDFLSVEENSLSNARNESEIRIVDLPQSVKNGVISKYVAYSIERVFKEQDHYKFILKGNQKKLIVYYTSDGEYLKQEAVKTIQMVAL